VASHVENRLSELGLTLPPPIDLPADRRPAIAFLRRDGDMLYLSGNGPFQGRRLVYAGKLGNDVSVDQGYDAARLTALNHVRTLVDAGIDLDRVSWIRALGMVNSAPGFTEQPAVVNGYSELIVELFGEERGLHARSAVGLAALPWNMAVEVEATCRLV
jgi:enamine deaminase RidA (YjgF/YER057c/UK114 family)